MSRFPIVTMAGFQGKPHPGMLNEDQIRNFSSGIKFHNNNTRVLYYQNTLINFPQTRLNLSVREDLLLHDKCVWISFCLPKTSINTTSSLCT